MYIKKYRRQFLGYRHSGDAYSLPIRKNGDCCGVLDTE